jgi:hypothetical protein
MSSLDDEFMESLFKGELNVDQVIALRIIKMSVRDYLYFGLGKNGITPEKFLDAYFYLFYIRSQDPRTWGDCSVSKRYRNLDGLLQADKISLSAQEVQRKCFDTHYDTTTLSKHVPLNKFLKLLKDKREKIVNANLKQIVAYISVFRAAEWNRLPKSKKKGKHSFPRVNIVPTLVAPESGKALAKLYLFGRTAAPKKNATNPKFRPTLLKYKCILF